MVNESNLHFILLIICVCVRECTCECMHICRWMLLTKCLYQHKTTDVLKKKLLLLQKLTGYRFCNGMAIPSEVNFCFKYLILHNFLFNFPHLLKIFWMNYY